ncbi:hypothetical protein O1L55_03635 [Streptomyces albulus]|nr:hypothetical protein [Streptomyces noursei]
MIKQTCLMLAVRAESATESIGFMDREAKVPAQSNATHSAADRPGAAT